ncbi:MAG: hypothetical protein IPJ77_22465 [Planctomycetes bacterium]|nr:hypothetical protein [Planctomycetota bacterium]
MHPHSTSSRGPLTACSLLLALVVGACSDSNAPQRVTAPGNASGAAKDTLLPEARAQGGEFRFTTPAGWVVEAPAQFRKLQFQLPRVDDDQDDAQVWVTDFGGGTREQNAERWIGEFDQPDGKPSAEVAKQSTRKVGKLDVFEVDVSGTCTAKMAPGSPSTMQKENWRQIAVILEGGSKPWYVKLRGPVATVTRWEASFRAFVDSAVVAP